MSGESTDLLDEPLTSIAACLQLHAAQERRYALDGGPAAIGATEEAERLEHGASRLMGPPLSAPLVRCGEVTQAEHTPALVWEVTNTLRDPDQVAIDASAQRTGLLLSVGKDFVAAAVDAAESAGAANSLEKMLTHQLALLHELQMKAGKRALRYERLIDPKWPGDPPGDAVEFARLCNSIARMHSHFCEGLLALQRIKHGGVRQTVEVRQVTVQPGAQAVIGNVRTGAVARRRKPKGRGRK